MRLLGPSVSELFSLLPHTYFLLKHVLQCEKINFSWVPT